MNQELRDELNQIAKEKAKSVWWNPQTHRSSIGEVYNADFGGLVPTYADEIFDHDKAKVAIQQYKNGSTNDSYKVTVDPFIGRWKNIAHELVDARKAGNNPIKQAGVGMAGDFSTIDIVNVQDQMVNTELRAFSLENAVTTVAVPNLLLSVDTYTRFTAQKSIGEGVPPVLKVGSASRTTFTLPKDGTAVGLTFEAQARNSHDIYRTSVDNAVTDLKRIKANKIAVEIETAADVSAGDWAAITSDHYTRSALDDIGTVTDTIVSNNGQADTIACHDRVARDLITNLGSSAISFTGHDVNVAGELGGFSVARSFTIPSTNITVYVDNEKTNTIASVYEKKSIYKMQGPVRTAVVRDELADVDMFRIFDFNLPKLIIAGRARDLTGVSA